MLKEHTLAIQYPTKSDYCNQQVPFFDPSFFKYKRYFKYSKITIHKRPFKIINKISDTTYEIVNQDGYTSHIHRNHITPYYPKEPVIFPSLQQYNPHFFKDNYSNINDQIINSDENQFSDEDQFSSTTFNKETDIPSTIDFQPESFSQYSSFPYQQKEQNSQNTNSDNQSDIHDYDNFINPRRHSYIRYNFRPQPRKDFSLVKRI